MSNGRVPVIPLVPTAVWRQIGAQFDTRCRQQPRTLPGAIGAIAASPGFVVLLDPSTFRQDAFDAITSAVARSGSPIVFYGRLSELAVERVLREIRQLDAEVVLSESIPTEVLLSICRHSVEGTVAATVLRGLANRLDLLPLRVRVATVSLFSWSDIPCTATDFARRSSTPQRTVQDHFRKANLRGYSVLRRAALLSRAWPDIANRGVSAQMVADRWGLETTRALSYGLRVLAGVSRLDAARLSAVEFASRLVRATTTDRTLVSQA